MRFLSCVCGNFWRWHDHFRRFQKKSEEVQKLPKKSEVFRSLRTCIKASSLPVFFSSQIRDREGGIVIYSFYTWFLFLTWVWVNIFLEIVSSMLARGQQLTFFNQAWEIGHWSLIGPQAWAGVRPKFSTVSTFYVLERADVYGFNSLRSFMFIGRFDKLFFPAFCVERGKVMD